MLPALLAAFALVSSLPSTTWLADGVEDPALPSDRDTVTYVAGSRFQEEGSIVCSRAFVPVVVGGACFLAPPDPTAFTLTVVDLSGAAVGFWWMGDGCGLEFRGSGVGTATGSLPPGCTKVTVWPDLGSAAGTITATWPSGQEPPLHLQALK